jgi:hypothetical protein
MMSRHVLQNGKNAKPGDIPHLDAGAEVVTESAAVNKQSALKSHWPGLSVHDEAGRISPPDQGLCVGNGFVVEAVNLVRWPPGGRLYGLYASLCDWAACECVRACGCVCVRERERERGKERG